jgi:hypothetical protein
VARSNSVHGLDRRLEVWSRAVYMIPEGSRGALNVRCSLVVPTGLR